MAKKRKPRLMQIELYCNTVIVTLTVVLVDLGYDEETKFRWFVTQNSLFGKASVKGYKHFVSDYVAMHIHSLDEDKITPEIAAAIMKDGYHKVSRPSEDGRIRGSVEHRVVR